MPTGPASSSYIIPPLTLSDTFYEWYSLTNNEIIDKLNRLKVYDLVGATGVTLSKASDGVVTVYIDTVIPGDHSFSGNITFNGTVTTVNTNLITIDDYNLVLGAVGSDGGTGGTSDTIITNSGGGGLVIAGSCGDKYFLWKAFEGGKTYTAWRISDALAFTGDAKFYSGNNKFVLSEGSDNTPASKVIVTTHSGGGTVDVETYFDSVGLTYTNMNILSDGSSRLVNSSVVKRFEGITNISAIGLTFGMVVRHDAASGGITLAKANNISNAESIGIAVNINNTQQFVDVNLLGYVTGNFADAIASVDSMSSLGTGEFYFLSESEAGTITKTAPSVTGNIRKPVLYALGSDKAMVMNYVGNKIVDTDTIYSKFNASTVIIKHEANLFSVGDTVRFEEGITAASRPFGSYVKASSNSTEEAEALGIISKINYGGNSAASLMTVSGFIDMSASGLTLESGMVYFLGAEPGSLTTTPPITVNTVRKPIMVAVSPTTGIVQNYVGLVITTNTDTGTSILIPQSGSGFRNKFINGNFDFWQRGNTFAFQNPTSQPDRYTADRWKLVNTGGSTADRLNVTVQKYPLGLGNLKNSSVYSANGLEFAIGTGGHTAGSETYLFQRIEGIEHFPSGYATISFYAQATVTNAKLGVSFRRDFGGGTAPDYATTGVEKNSQKHTGFVTNLPTEWTKFSYTFALPDSKNGTIGASGTDGPEIKFYLRAGTDLVGEDVTEEIDPNLAGVNDYRIRIAQVQFEYGQDATPFELNDPTSELNRCLRYYQTNTTDATLFSSLTDGNANCLNNDALEFDGGIVQVRYPVEIRDASTSTVDVKRFGVTVSATTKSKRGFKATKNPGTVYLNYQVESEL
jgi:hypothetical protein